MRRLAIAFIVAAALPALPNPFPETRARGAPDIVRQTCIQCHGPGLGGAPRIGNAKEWRQRARVGFDALVRSATEGKGAMPARGGVPDLTEEELRAAIAYMSGIAPSPDGL